MRHSYSKLGVTCSYNINAKHQFSEIKVETRNKVKEIVKECKLDLINLSSEIRIGFYDLSTLSNKNLYSCDKKSIRKNLSARLIDWNGEIFDHLESNSKEFDQYLSWWSYKKFKENIYWKNSLKKHKNFIRNNFIRNKCLNNFFKKIDANDTWMKGKKEKEKGRE